MIFHCQGRRHRGRSKGAKAPLKISKKKKGKMSSLPSKYVLWKGLYHDFSTKKGSSFKGASSPDPHQGALPLGPQRFLRPPNDLPWRRSCSPYVHVVNYYNLTTPHKNHTTYYLQFISFELIFFYFHVSRDVIKIINSFTLHTKQ